MKFRPTLYPTIATVLGLILLISLGTWQFRQFQRKRALEQEKSARADDTTTDVRHASSFDDQSLGHRRVRLHGELLADTRIVFESRFLDGEPGVWLASPLKLSDGGFVLVNRGWVPFRKAKDELPDDLATPAASGHGQLDAKVYLGVAHPIDRPVEDAFMRKQIADGEVDVWQRETRWDSVDIPAVTDALAPHIDGEAPKTAILVSLTNQHSGDPHPKANADLKVQKFLTAGRHLGYSVFWFTVAAALLGMYIASGFGVLGSFSRGSRRKTDKAGREE